MVVLEPGRPRSFLRRRRHVRDLQRAIDSLALEPKVTGGGTYAALIASAALGNLPKLGRFIALRLPLLLDDPNPFRDVLGLLAHSHAPDVLVAVGIDVAAPLEVADRAHLFLDVDRRGRAVDRAARIVPVVGRGDRAAGDDAPEQAERCSPADANAIARLSSRMGAK